MMLEIAVGDAYGAGFEYADKEFIKKYNNLEDYVEHPKFFTKKGRYTDDTQMSIGIAELLIEEIPPTKKNLADKFVKVFKRDPRTGYSPRFYDLLSRVKDGKDLIFMIHPESEKSGAAMRAGPIGFLSDINEVKKYVTIQARLTHDTSLGINAAVASALMTHYFIYDLGDKMALGTFIEKHVAGKWSKPWIGEVGEKGYMSVIGAITAITQENTLSDILKRCVDFTGDVDTVAAIAMAAASNSKEIEQDLPIHLITSLENNNYGKDYLISLDEKLKERFREAK